MLLRGGFTIRGSYFLKGVHILGKGDSQKGGFS